ncbi:MAG: NAD(P)/FAD-dependent oxidoreductase [Ilumatobacter sp.]|uniref:flavin-containing monooxygenase n=1 Tax=Ilumatobacter sp. TaxID=1967498 RepID=UPI003C78B620
MGNGTALQHVDVLVVGAGLSGIGMACHLTRECPTKSYAIIEARQALGGTWDLFKYPGIRTDSDMHTFGYDFKPWKSSISIVEADLIKNYIEEAADEYDVTRHITFGRRVVDASWDSETSTWTVTTRPEVDGEVADHPTDDDSTMTCNWLQMCSGYYSYNEPHRPDFPGEERFGGEIVHPQFWPDHLQTREQLDGKKIVVVGSGATAITLIPAIAELGAQVTMLQRTPSWIFPAPQKNPIAIGLRALLPEKVAYRAIRKMNTWRTEFTYKQTRTKPEKIEQLINKQVAKKLDGSKDMDPHFTPPYKPWDQRLCLSPDGDIFTAIKEGRADVVTDHIETFDETGILLTSGERLDADVIVTATGLSMLALGGVVPVVDGEQVDIAETFTYKGFMYSGVPNLGTTFGYINASWTLRADLIARYICRLLQKMDDNGSSRVVPIADPDMPQRPYVDDFSAGYMQRRVHTFPKQSDRDPWTASQSYSHDKKVLLGPDADVDDGVMEFSSPVRQPTPA